MRITFNTIRFPTVRVKLTNETDTNNEYYNKFMDYWEAQYEYKSHFNFLFDFQELSKPNLFLVFDFIKRLKRLKCMETQYLDYSIIVNKNPLLLTILKNIWNISPPLSTIYIVSQMLIAEQLHQHINNKFLDNDFILSFIMCNNVTKI